ncbi:MAG: hypothetical protein Q9216_001808 [Gyalolechia sp. 2 TL-2023]
MKSNTNGVTVEEGVPPLQATLTQGTIHRTYDDTIRISGAHIGSIDISFQRTIRVPDNQGESKLPPTFGTFPLYPVTRFQKTLPATMTMKGGLFFPMYQREAMWINFASKFPFAVKVYLGGVNAISGEPFQENSATTLHRLTKIANNESIQDYLVTPKQLWLDGIATTTGSVRQFVAMPLGSGYSVEAQITGQEVTGGMQFSVTPTARLRNFPRPPGSITLFVKTLTGKTLTISNLVEDDTITDLHDILEDSGILIFAGTKLEARKCSTIVNFFAFADFASVDRTIGFYSIPDRATLHFVLRLRGGGYNKGPRSELGIAPGGLIKQCIQEDTLPASAWDINRAVSFNVQILNSQLFRQVTGLPPPKTPISAQTYAVHRLPFFDIYDETSNVQGKFEGIKSIAPVAKEEMINKGKKSDEKAVESSVDNSIILLNQNGTHCGFKPVSVLKEELARINHAQF